MGGVRGVPAAARARNVLSTDSEDEPRVSAHTDKIAPAKDDVQRRSEPTGKARLRMAGQAAQFAVALVNESEGTESNFLGSVPNWISFARLPGMRYRYVYKVKEVAGLGFSAGASTPNLQVHALPGVPGWADEIGPVSIIYSGRGLRDGSLAWFVFRKLLPFSKKGEQDGAPLLLGTERHVRRTRRDVSAIRFAAARTPAADNSSKAAAQSVHPAQSATGGDSAAAHPTAGGGPGTGSTGGARSVVLCKVLRANGGGEATVPFSSLRPVEKYRLWLAWSHPASERRRDVEGLRVARGMDSPLSIVPRLLLGALHAFVGYDPVMSDSWAAQPFQQVDPAYYSQLSVRVAALLKERKRLKRNETAFVQEHERVSAQMSARATANGGGKGGKAGARAGEVEGDGGSFVQRV